MGTRVAKRDFDMTTRTAAGRKPAITLHRTDHDRLYRLAEAFAARNPGIAEELLTELDRAKVVAKPEQTRGSVAIGSVVRYATESGEQRTVTLTYPANADIEQGRISVMTPIGIALLGLTKGQSMNWTGRDGKSNRLTVMDVTAHPATETVPA